MIGGIVNKWLLANSGSVTCGIVNLVQKWRGLQRGAIAAQPEELPGVAGGGRGPRGNLRSRLRILAAFTLLLPMPDGRATARWPGRPGCCAPAGAGRGHSVMSAR